MKKNAVDYIVALSNIGVTLLERNAYNDAKVALNLALVASRELSKESSGLSYTTTKNDTTSDVWQMLEQISTLLLNPNTETPVPFDSVSLSLQENTELELISEVKTCMASVEKDKTMAIKLDESYQYSREFVCAVVLYNLAASYACLLAKEESDTKARALKNGAAQMFRLSMTVFSAYC